MACQDLAGTAQLADFDWFEYRERDYVADVTSETGAPAASAETGGVFLGPRSLPTTDS